MPSCCPGRRGRRGAGGFRASEKKHSLLYRTVRAMALGDVFLFSVKGETCVWMWFEVVSIDTRMRSESSSRNCVLCIHIHASRQKQGVCAGSSGSGGTPTGSQRLGLPETVVGSPLGPSEPRPGLEPGTTQRRTWTCLFDQKHSLVVVCSTLPPRYSTQAYMVGLNVTPPPRPAGRSGGSPATDARST